MLIKVLAKRLSISTLQRLEFGMEKQQKRVVHGIHAIGFKKGYFAVLTRTCRVFSSVLFAPSGRRSSRRRHFIFWISVVPSTAGRAACQCALPFRGSLRHSWCGWIASFSGHCVSCPEDACPQRFSWFFNWIQKVQKFVDLVDIETCCNMNICSQKSA